MKLKMFLSLATVFSLLWVGGCTKRADNKTNQASSMNDHEDPEGYYTCPMHPQVHEHKPGKCPICGMELVKVSGKQQQVEANSTSSNELQVSERQLLLAGIGKYTVSKKDLVFVIPASGRLISSREVAFQVYESDLKNIEVGLDFTGQSGTSEDETLSGQIRYVDSIVDPSSRTVRVLGILGRSPKRVVVDTGFYGEIKVIKKSQIAVPEDAVLHAGKRDLVYIITKENKIRASPVTVGQKAAREYQIMSGLNEGDVISTGPNFLIDSEAKIRGTSGLGPGETKSSAQSCPPDQHWDIPMSMCMPGEARK